MILDYWRTIHERGDRHGLCVKSLDTSPARTAALRFRPSRQVETAIVSDHLVLVALGVAQADSDVVDPPFCYLGVGSSVLES